MAIVRARGRREVVTGFMVTPVVLIFCKKTLVERFSAGSLNRCGRFRLRFFRSYQYLFVIVFSAAGHGAGLRVNLTAITLADYTPGLCYTEVPSCTEVPSDGQ